MPSSSSRPAISLAVSCPGPVRQEPVRGDAPLTNHLCCDTDAVWEETRESTSLDILETYAVMRSALNMPVFGTLGNQ